MEPKDGWNLKWCPYCDGKMKDDGPIAEGSYVIERIMCCSQCGATYLFQRIRIVEPHPMVEVRP